MNESEGADMMNVATSRCVYGEEREREREFYKLERPPSQRGAGAPVSCIDIIQGLDTAH
jgi:hypothetical protein